MVRAETVTNMRTQAYDHIVPGDIKRKNSYPQREWDGGSPKEVGKAEAVEASKVKIHVGVLRVQVTA